jgi:LuxR family transcriptional regulator, transcriptional activator of the bioluminescence operon
MDFSEYTRLESSLRGAKTKIQIKDVCIEFCEIYGFDFFLFGLRRPSSLTSPEIIIVDNYPKKWRDIYTSENLIKVDPTVEYCKKHCTPVRWDKLSALDEFSRPEHREFMNRAKSFNLVSGFTVPLWSPFGDFALLSLASSLPIEETEARCDKALPNSLLFANVIMECILGQIAEKVAHGDMAPLSKRERECLFWVCDGKTTWEVSKIVGISKRTVIFHLINCVEKLGACNRQHAVAKAILYGLIKPDL